MSSTTAAALPARRTYRYPPITKTDRADIPTSPPADFDAAAHPIIARHVFGLKTVGEIAVEVVGDQRTRRMSAKVHHLSDRATVGLLASVPVDGQAAMSGSS